MTASTIQLGSSIFITDPCYSVGTWCQLKKDNVLPGSWVASMIYDEAGGTNRNAELHVVHQDFQNKNLSWDWIGDFGVDSGQAGIFDAASYRNDAAAGKIQVPESDFVLPRFDSDEGGVDWYEAMCKLTLSQDGWGAYDQGVVSSSGWGDGMYAAYGAEVDGKLVALQLVFIDQSAEDEEDDWDEDLKFVEDQEADL